MVEPESLLNIEQGNGIPCSGMCRICVGLIMVGHETPFSGAGAC